MQRYIRNHTCGLTHVLSIYTLWVPVHGIEGQGQGRDAAASLFTASTLWPLLPKLLAIPSPFELRKAREELEQQKPRWRDSQLLLLQIRESQRALREPDRGGRNRRCAVFPMGELPP